MSDWIAVLIALGALGFTITSFWWLNARRGRLETYEPHSFAAHVSRTAVRLRLPLVLYNTGARPLIVQDLRLYFPKEDVPLADLQWSKSHTHLAPNSVDNRERYPAVFAVPGRAAQQHFVEFGGAFPGVVPQGRDYVVRVEAKLGHKPAWIPLLTFTLRAGHIIQPDNYRAYYNSNVPCSPDEVEKAQKALRELAEHFGVELPERQT